MTKLMIRVDAELSEEMAQAFPQLTRTLHPAHTTLTGEVVDQQELQGVLNWLSRMGVDVLEVITIPD